MRPRNSSSSLYVTLNRSHSLHFVRTRDHFGKQSCAELVTPYPNGDNLLEISAWNLWKSTRKLWNFEVPPFTTFFCQHFEQDRHSLQTADHFALHRENVRPSLNILQHCLTMPSLFTFWP
jgi:hypothetical protein